MIGLVVRELSIGAPMVITTFELHRTSQKPLLGPRVCLGSCLKMSCWRKDRAFQKTVKSMRNKGKNPPFWPI